MRAEWLIGQKDVLLLQPQCFVCIFSQLDFWMGRSLDGSLTNDNLVEGDKLIDYQDFIFFFFFFTIQITVSSFYRKIQRGHKLMFLQYKP